MTLSEMISHYIGLVLYFTNSGSEQKSECFKDDNSALRCVSVYREFNPTKLVTSQRGIMQLC